MRNFFKSATILGLIILVLAVAISAKSEKIVNSSYMPTGNGNLPHLYKVDVSSQSDAEILTAIGVDALLKIDNGYLVLVKSVTENSLFESGLKIELIAKNVDRDLLALDIRLDDGNINKYPIVFEENNIRIFKVDPSDFSRDGETPGLAPILTRNIRIIYNQPKQLQFDYTKDVIGLDSIISLIDQDSLLSYVEALQAFPPRVTGSASDYASRDWIYDKFVEFGYDSVVFDTFSYSGDEVQNIVAYKIGTTFPDHQVVVGAHKDAVSSSPGADDNGSGTAGVLEIARVLKDIETDMTFIFILFDGEEQGLHGAWHYADAAAANGDSIVVMVNMDMIGYEGNTNHTTIYHSSDNTIAQLWVDLADSLTDISLTGHLSGTSAYSDHYAFQQNGYDVVFAIEYEFSSVYHTYQDSTSYMDFSYMARNVKACLATAYAVNYTYIPTPSLKFSYPGGLPSVLTPGVPETFQVQVEGSSGGIPMPGTGILYYDVEGSMPQSKPMDHLGGDLYEVTFPVQNCARPVVDFWVSAEERTTGIIYDPDPSDPYVAVVATDVVAAFADDFETDQDWAVSGGLWARGTPTGNGGQYGNPDPSGAHAGSNIYGYNLNGDYENSMPERHLTSPAIDCSGLSNVQLNFWRWLGVEQPSYDHAYIRISNDGSSWTTIWTNTEEITDNTWLEMTYDISAYADNQSTVYVRFTMGTTDGGWQYCGWNIDDLEVTGYMCDQSEFIIVNESLPDWTAEYPYSQQLASAGGTGNITWSDKLDDLLGTGLTISSSGLVSGTVTSAQTINFTAVATDEAKISVEKLFTFEINPALDIATTTLPEWTAGSPYSVTLQSTGGTAPTAWSDKYSDLSGTGLSLGTNGTISGTPISAGVISFTANITDFAGSSDEAGLNITINPAVSITSTSTPDGTVGVAYSQQLTSDGGTGPINWVDKNGDLSTTGLTLTAQGLLSGTPTASGSISFTALASDSTGSNYEILLSFDIFESFMCGDASGDALVNILDITFIIDFLYKGGPAPNPVESADVDNSGEVNILDVTYLIAYLYKGGPDPVCP